MDLQFGNSNEMAQENEVFRLAHTDLDWMRIITCLQSDTLRMSPTRIADFLKLDIGFVMSTIEKLVEHSFAEYSSTGFRLADTFHNKSTRLGVDFGARQKAILFSSQINRYMSEQNRKASFGSYVYLIDKDIVEKLKNEVNSVFEKYIETTPSENSVLIGGLYSLVRLSSENGENQNA